MNLGPAGEPGLDQQAPAPVGNSRLELFDELRSLRPRADDRHVPAQHVPELRELVEVRPAEDAAEGRHPRIVHRGPARRAGLLGVGAHRPELVHLEQAASLAGPDLTEENGALGPAQGQRDERKQRGAQQEAERGADDVE